MIICGTCHKENEDFFKFCLGCGADLSKAARLDEGVTVEAAASSSELEPLTRRAGGSSQQVASNSSRTCRICGAQQDREFAFCADCGASFAELTKTGPVPAVTVEPPRSGVSKGRLVLVREDGTDGDSFDLDAAGTIVGRETGHITFPEDDFLASEHLKLFYQGDELVVHPSESTNGVYIRVFDQVEIAAGDRLRIGQELLEYSAVNDDDQSGKPDREGTLPLGSPVSKDAWGRLRQLLGPDSTGEAFVLRGRETFIGRERGDIRFPQDGYVSGSHAVISRANGVVSLRDLGSSNGTFIRLKGERTLRQGDFILVGQQLLRFEP